MTYAGRDYSPDAIAARLFNTPLMVTQAKLDAIMGVLGPKFDVARLMTPEGVLMPADLEAAAKAEKHRVGASRYGSPDRIFQMADSVAVIPIRGTLVQRNGLDPYSGMTGYDGLARKLEAAEADPDVRGIVFDIDSPGGEVSGCFDLADMIAAAAKPTRAILTEHAYSAAYALASCCDDIVVPRTGGAGSIGVIAMHMDVSRAADAAGVDVTLIYAGSHKADGNPYEPLPDDVHADFQAEIDDMFVFFAGHVALQRDMPIKAVLDLQSRALNADDALAAGLVDAIASPREAMTGFLARLNGSSPSADGLAAGNRGERLMRKNGKRAEGDDKKPEAENDEDKKDWPKGEGPDDDPKAEDEDDGDPKAEGDDADPDKDEGKKAGRNVIPMKGDRNNLAETEAAAIVQTCALAGCPERANGFIEAGMSAAKVRSTLLAEQADASAANGITNAHGSDVKTNANEGAVMSAAFKKVAARKF